MTRIVSTRMEGHAVFSFHQSSLAAQHRPYCGRPAGLIRFPNLPSVHARSPQASMRMHAHAAGELVI